MGPYGIWDLGSGGPNVEIWDREEDGDGWGPMGSEIWGRVALKWMGGWGGMNGFLWDVGFGVGWTNPNVDLWDWEEDVGWMGSHKIWDLGLNGPKVELWDRDEDGDGWGPMGSEIWD